MKKRLSELQKQMLFILGQTLTWEIQRIGRESYDKLFKENYHKHKCKTLGDLFRIAEKKGFGQEPLNLTDIRMSLIDFRKHLMDVIEYGSHNSAKATISKSHKNLINKKLVKVHDLGGQKYISMTKQGYKEYEKVYSKIKPYLGLYENFKEDKNSPII